MTRRAAVPPEEPRRLYRLAPEQWQQLCEFAAKEGLVPVHGEFVIGDVIFSPSKKGELERLRDFVQWVADHSSDPDIVAEALKHGAEG